VRKIAEDKRRTALLILLVVVIVVGVYHMMSRSGNRPAGSGEELPYTGRGRVNTNLRSSAESMKRFEKNIVKRNASPVRVSWRAWQRNPFLPVEKPVVALIPGGKARETRPEFKLEGIIRGGRVSIAIINGKSVKEGGSVGGGWRLVSVGEYRVTLRGGGRKLTLGLVSLEKGRR